MARWPLQRDRFLRCRRVLHILHLGIVSAAKRAFARRQAATNIQLEKARTEISEALNNISNGLVMVAGDGTIRLFNDRVVDMFHLEPAEIAVGMPLSQRLRTFPFDKIKIDGSFVKDAVKREDCAAVVRAVADLGKRLGVSIVAEGVETEAPLSAWSRKDATSFKASTLASLPQALATFP